MARTRIVAKRIVAAALCGAVTLFSAPAFTGLSAQLRGSKALRLAGPAAQSLYDPAGRMDEYKGNIAKYLVDLHDAKGTFDFCGGMMFQMVLSEKLRTELAAVAGDEAGRQPVVHEANTKRMAMMSDYSKSAAADNVHIFHGREVRKVPDAAGGMNFVIHLSHTDDDPEGWSTAEIEDYNGWAADHGRKWRSNADGLWPSPMQKFGKDAFGLHHRFYLHLDGQNGFWLSAEDGCEGKAAQGPETFFENMQRELASLK